MITSRGCLEIKLEVEEKNPLIHMKEKLHGHKGLRVIPYFPSVGGKEYLVEFILDHKEGMLDEVKDFIEKQSAKGGMRYLRDSERFINGNDIINCWVKSPVFDLVNPCIRDGIGILTEYRLLKHNPSEYCYIVGKKDELVEKLLRPAFKKVKGNMKKVDWIFHNKPEKIRYSCLTLLEGYKLGTALESRFFVTRNETVLDGLANELSIVTGKKYTGEILSEEVKKIAAKLFKYVKKGNYEVKEE